MSQQHPHLSNLTPRHQLSLNLKLIPRCGVVSGHLPMCLLNSLSTRIFTESVTTEERQWQRAYQRRPVALPL